MKSTLGIAMLLAFGCARADAPDNPPTTTAAAAKTAEKAPALTASNPETDTVTGPPIEATPASKPAEAKPSAKAPATAKTSAPATTTKLAKATAEPTPSPSAPAVAASADNPEVDDETDDELPTPQDFEDEAAASIDEDSLEAELAAIERELGD